VDSKSDPAAVGTASAPKHASGDALLAVAEGNAETQPDEATVEHIFSCDRCSQNVRDIRTSLAALGATAMRKPAAAKPAAAAPAPSAPVDARAVLDSMPPIASTDDSDPSRKMIWKVVLIGAVLAAALFFLRSFATGLR
jgi:hypothetical protein